MWFLSTVTSPVLGIEMSRSVDNADTYFFWSFLFFSAEPDKVPIPAASFGELSASGVPAKTHNVKNWCQERGNNTIPLEKTHAIVGYQ